MDELQIMKGILQEEKPKRFNVKIIRDIRILERALRGERGSIIARSHGISQTQVERIIKRTAENILNQRIDYLSPITIARKFEEQILNRLQQKKEIITRIEQLENQLNEQLSELHI